MFVLMGIFSSCVKVWWNSYLQWTERFPSTVPLCVCASVSGTSLLFDGTYSSSWRAPVRQAGGSHQTLPFTQCWRWSVVEGTEIWQPCHKNQTLQREKRLCPPHTPHPASYCTHTHTHKVKKSSRSERKHAARACQCRSGWWGSTRTERFWRRRTGKKREGRKIKTRLKWSYMNWRARSRSALWPFDPSVLLLCSDLSTLPSCLWVFALLPSSSSVVSWLLIRSETGSQRDIAPYWYHAVSLTHSSQMPLTHPFRCLPSTCEWAAVTGGRRRHRETEREEGKGGQKRALERQRPVYSARMTENSLKCWAMIMLSNMDCDFLGEKQPALVNLEWLWNNLDSSRIVDCHKRSALQQFVAAQ